MTTGKRKHPPAWAVAEARERPNGWVYEIHGDYGLLEHVPPEAIRGAWPVGPDGIINGQFVENPNFRPNAAM